MLSLLEKDMKLTFQAKSIFIFLFLYIPFIIFVDIFEPTDMNSVYLVAVLTFTYIGVSTPFQYELKNKTHLFIQSLPVNRISIVISRYIYALIIFIFSALFSYIYFKVLVYLGLSSDVLLSFGFLKQLLFTVVSIISFLLPINYIFDPKISNFLTILLYIFIFTFLPQLLKNFSIIKDNDVIIFTLTIVLFLSSLFLSIYINNRRNFS